MPKIIELTVEIDIQRVSCPGVWLCQDGRVSLSVFALGTSYQTCLLPPMFPLTFKDVFYFRKRFQETCALNNICCLLKEETIYCELVQWCEDCRAQDCVILAQYLGALNDVMFPPNMCSNEGVDLLMRRSKVFPGILSPKIEIATKVRIDEVWNQCGGMKGSTCYCGSDDSSRQKQVCHTPLYHRHKCSKPVRPASVSRSRSHSGSRSSCTLNKDDPPTACQLYPNPITIPPPHNKRSRRPRSATRSRPCAQYSVYSVHTPDSWPGGKDTAEYDDSSRSTKDPDPSDEEGPKVLLESRYIEEETARPKNKLCKRFYKPKVTPCVCEICKKYHEFFHSYKLN